MMIPREGELLALNMTAQYDGPGTDGEAPTISIGGMAVTFYVTYPGILRVSVHTEGAIDPRIMTGEDDCPLIEFAVNGSTVHAC